MVIQRQRCLSGNRLINSHSLFVTESNKTLGRTEGLGTALPALLVKKERVTKPLRKPAWKATSLPDFVQSSLAVIHSYQLCLRDLSEISRGGGGVETEGGSHLFETAEKGGVMKNGLLKGGGSCKYVSVIM